jgi:hypothetical protein
VTAGSTWYIRIGSTANVGGGGTLRTSVVAPVCVGDFDFSGAVDSADLGAQLLDFGFCQDCITDLDGDNTVDSSDAGLVLLNFGSCN